MKGSVVERVPQLRRGKVWCTVCGRMERVDAGACLTRTGWPKCCGYTMTIDSPEEQARFRSPYRDCKPIRKYKP